MNYGDVTPKDVYRETGRWIGPAIAVPAEDRDGGRGREPMTTTETDTAPGPGVISPGRAACEAFWAAIGAGPDVQEPGAAWKWAISQQATGAWEAAAKAAAKAGGGEDVGVIREQARRYLVAVHGPEWLYRAPETFAGPERWVWAVANSQGPMAATAIADIERVCAEHREGARNG